MSENLAWWQKTVVYQIYPMSFCDSNGDGIGDIPGIISKLDYLKDLGVETLWLSPIYKSPNEDNGYDISDYCSVHPDYGTMEDFDLFVSEANRRGLKIIMDLVINHTSSEHEWFQKSRRGIEPYKDFYFWSDSWPGTPNNWTGFFGGGCWEYDDVRQAYYLHMFAKHQPDLNYHCPLVWEEIKKVLKFWLDKGVMGFRCDVINMIWKDSLENGKKRMILTGLEHYATLEGTHSILREMNEILQPYGAMTVGETVCTGTKEATLLTDPERKELNMVFGFEHMNADSVIVKWLKRPFRWKPFINAIDKWLREVPWNTIYFENHDQPRSVSRYGSEKYSAESAKLLALMLLTLRATPFIFEGEEIGMTNFDFKGMDEIRDVESHNVYKIMKSMGFPSRLRWKLIRLTSRDNARTPMQWSADENAGFTSGSPWLGINSNYRQINVEAELADPNSLLNCYKKIIALRKDTPDLISGDYELLVNEEECTSYKRGDLIITLNHQDDPMVYEDDGEILFSTYGDRADGILRPWEAVISVKDKKQKNDERHGI